MKIKTTTTEIKEVTTRQDYVIIEESDDHRAEIYCHGYDREDADVYDKIKELQFENPEYKYRLMFLREVNV